MDSNKSAGLWNFTTKHCSSMLYWESTALQCRRTQKKHIKHSKVDLLSLCNVYVLLHIRFLWSQKKKLGNVHFPNALHAASRVRPEGDQSLWPGLQLKLNLLSSFLSHLCTAPPPAWSKLIKTFKSVPTFCAWLSKFYNRHTACLSTRNVMW